jgi:predicted deacylase
MQRLGKNHGGYHGETIDILAVTHQIKAKAISSGWSVRTFHQSDPFEWLALHRPASGLSNRPDARRVYLSAGIHGDEPAGPLSVLELLSRPGRSPHLDLTLVPCLNPSGFRERRRANAHGVDLNRDYLAPTTPEIRAHVAWLERQRPFDLCLCLHEDWESSGFYLYELNPDAGPSLAAPMIAAAASACPIDLSPVIEGRPAHGGIIRPSLDPALRAQWPESFWLLQHKTRLSYTLEAPSDFPLATRVQALAAAVEATLASPLLA